MLPVEIDILRSRASTVTDAHHHTLDAPALWGIFPHLLDADYGQVLSNESFLDIFQINACLSSTGENNAETLRSLDGVGAAHIRKAFEHLAGQDVLARELCLLSLGVSLLQTFLQNNWLGPPLELPPWLHQLNKGLESEALGSGGLLAVDGEAPNPNVCCVACLLLARTIFITCRDLFVNSKTVDWWALRCLYLHQSLLDERSASVKASVMQLIDAVGKTEELLANVEYRDLAMEFHLEAGHLLYFYYEPSLAEQHFKTAHQISGLHVELTGAMGKRTRFQERDLSQLVLNVQRPVESQPLLYEAHSIPKQSVPRNVPLDDETVLEEIEFSDNQKDFAVRLQPVEQAVILGLCHHHRRTSETKGSILEEETMAYLNCVLAQPISWCVQTKALLQRTHWETESPRRMQRSLAQLEELAAQFKHAKPSVSNRILLAYCCSLPPQWEIERELGDFQMRIGGVKSALEIFLRLTLWEDVIKCYTSLGRREKAEEIIRAQLAEKETDALWCYLGDVTHLPEHYERAWELSGGHCARAQRSLGFLHLNKGQFEQSLPFFEKAVAINALQVPVWFSYGCAALACSQFKTAAKAFRRCVNLVPENYEAWNNLASAYIKDNQKVRAFLSLHEAVRLDYENWRIWENYCLLGADIGEFQDSIRAYHRLLDLKDKFADAQVLKIFVRAVTENLPDARDEPSGRLRSEVRKLLGRVTAKVTTNGDIWRLYGELLLSDENKSTEDQQIALQCLQKAHRCNTQRAGWEKDPEACREVASSLIPLLQRYLQCAEEMTEAASAIQLLSSARLAAKGVVAKIRQHHSDLMTKEVQEDLKEPCYQLEEMLNALQAATDARKGS